MNKQVSSFQDLPRSVLVESSLQRIERKGEGQGAPLLTAGTKNLPKQGRLQLADALHVRT